MENQNIHPDIPQDAETKSAPFALFKADKIKGERTRAGIFSVLGNRDKVGDRVMSGAFSKTWKDGRKNIVHLWDHGESGQTFPTASIDDLYEIGKSDLPDEVLMQAPDAIGAAVVVRTYIRSPIGDHFLAAVDAGAIQQMSFAYGIPKEKSFRFDEEIGGEKVSTRGIREVKQYDTSDVRWGCNGATIAQIKSLFGGQALDVETLAKHFDAIMTEFKSGRYDYSNDLKTLQQIFGILSDMGITRVPMELPKASQSDDFQMQMTLLSARFKSLHASQPSR